MLTDLFLYKRLLAVADTNKTPPKFYRAPWLSEPRLSAQIGRPAHQLAEEKTLESLTLERYLTLYLELISLEGTTLESLTLERYPALTGCATTKLGLTNGPWINNLESAAIIIALS